MKIYSISVLSFLLLILTYKTPLKSNDKKNLAANEIFKSHCFDCHDEDTQKSNINIEKSLLETNKTKQKDFWLKTWEVLKNDLMPPPHKTQLSEKEKESLISWIQTEAFHYNPKQPDPGRITLRRLNREEYNNTVNDLFDLKIQLKENFPTDDTGFGFDNIGSVLTMSPLLTEKYISASSQILEHVFPDENPEIKKVILPLDKFKRNPFDSGSNSLTLVSNYELTYTDDIIYEGEYDYFIFASGDQAGSELVKMKAGIHETKTEEFEIKTKRSNLQQNKIRIKLLPGQYDFFVGFINDYYNPDDPNPKQRDRNLIIHSVYRQGPINPAKKQASPFEERWLSPANSQLSSNQLVDKFLKSFLPLAYRRPVTQDEINQKKKFFDKVYGNTKSIKLAFKWTSQAILMSPHFLFKGELSASTAQKEPFKINEFALATRLSYFLWSSMPDEHLTNLAKNNLLRKNLSAEIKRMLLDKKSQSLTSNFLGQWLQLRNLELARPSNSVFPTFNRSLMQAAILETQYFFQHIITEDRSVLELLDCNYTFLNNRLAKHYDIKGVNGSEMRKVELKDKRRGGLITQASVLMVTSYPTRTSLVLRGKYILENFFGYTPPNPPPEMPSLADKENTKEKTLRERIQSHASDPKCASCHTKFDPMGYALENYDGIGQWRTTENGQELNTKGVLISGESFDGPIELKELMAKQKKDLFTRCLIKKLLTYALGRGLAYYDEVEVDQILNNTAKNNYKFSELIISIANSTPFQMQRPNHE